MRFTTPRGVAFDIPDDWWAFADMPAFKVTGKNYAWTGIADLVPLADVDPVVRNPGVPLLRKRKLVPVLFALQSDDLSLDPVPVRRLPDDHPYRYRPIDGTHRYYASAAVGFELLPVVIY